MLNRFSPCDPLPDALTNSLDTAPLMVDEATEARGQRADLSWKRHLEDLAAFHAHYGRTPSSIRPVNAGEERLARWWHRQLVAAGRQTLTAEQACLLDNLFSPSALDDLAAC